MEVIDLKESYLKNIIERFNKLTKLNAIKSSNQNDFIFYIISLYKKGKYFITALSYIVALNGASNPST